MRTHARSMLIALVWMGVVSASTLQGPTSSQEEVCPTVAVNCGDAKPAETTPITFIVTVKGGKPIGEVSYCWTVENGTIKSGQGTAVIEVEAEGQDRKGLTGVVSIGGFDPKCAQTASCSTPIP